jgi:hypothetical protein
MERYVSSLFIDEKTFAFRPYLLFILAWTADLGMYVNIVLKRISYVLYFLL